jgi:hypothetical protein
MTGSSKKENGLGRKAERRCNVLNVLNVLYIKKSIGIVVTVWNTWIILKSKPRKKVCLD